MKLIGEHMSNVDFIFPYRKDSDEREQNLIKCLNYYKTYFNEASFIISEQGLVPTFYETYYQYTFNKKDLPHNQARCINQGVLLSKKKIICIIDVDIILLNYYNIFLAIKDIFDDVIDYALPYNNCVNLPNFDFRTPWGGKDCIGGIYVVNREKFIQSGMNNELYMGWGREDDDRHRNLIKSGLRFKRYDGFILHMDHPLQLNADISEQINDKLFNDLGNDNSSSNQI